MLSPQCDECKKPLELSTKMISVPDLTFLSKTEQSRGYRNLHFCDGDCLRSWMVKNESKSVIAHG